MNKPELYLNSVARSQTRYSRHIMENYFPLIRHESNKMKSVLDIGCGPGNTIHDVLFPYLEQDTFEIIGTDISPSMINHANKAHYGDDRITFKEVDVGAVVPEDFVERFDYIFSFWTFHWIQDQKKLYSNALKMLKPNGSLLVTYIANSKYFDIIQEVCKREKYACVISKISLPPFQTSKHPQEQLFSILRDAEFENIFCKVETIRTENYTLKDMEDIIISLSPNYDGIPKNLRKEFVLDHVDLLDTMIDTDNEKKYYSYHNMFIVHGRKKGD
ncbi:hypothetical protein RI129_000864 [Pyrocoelia pectoralis]|uniref:Methyltransferase domain-containing protein n=1 Tax=Pyrocoelia pectoralis TaxID=417401 RepID=A0AAN7ZJK9_9COLE